MQQIKYDWYHLILLSTIPDTWKSPHLLKPHQSICDAPSIPHPTGGLRGNGGVSLAHKNVICKISLDMDGARLVFRPFFREYWKCGDIWAALFLHWIFCHNLNNDWYMQNIQTYLFKFRLFKFRCSGTGNAHNSTKESINLHIHTYTCIRTYVCTYVRTYIHHACMHAYIHTYKHTYMHVYMHTYIHT